MKKEYFNEEIGVKMLELSGDEENEFVKEMQTNSYVMTPEVTKVFRIALEDESVLILGQIDKLKYKKVFIKLIDRNLKLYYV